MRPAGEPISLSGAGYAPDQRAEILEATRYSEGMFLFSGPEGSGRRTSQRLAAYAIPDGRCVVDLTDPDGRWQDRRAGERLMEAAVRQDAEVMLLGELTNGSRVEQASELTEQGNAVLAVLGAGRAHRIHSELLALGMRRELLTLPRFLRGGVAQRLLPANCPRCSVPMRSVRRLGSEREGPVRRLTDLDASAEAMHFANPDGCGDCVAGTQGWVLVAEVMVADDALLELLARKDAVAVERHLIDEAGMLSLRAHALAKIADGALDPLTAEAALGRIGPNDLPPTHSGREMSSMQTQGHDGRQ